MRRYCPALFIGLLLAGGLACGTSGAGQEPTAVPATGVATPTLAPTATADPNAAPDGTATLTAEEATAVALAEPTSLLPATPPAGGTATNGGSGNGNNGSNGGANGGNGQNGSGATAPCPAGGQNLVANPSFEGDYRPFGAFNELNHAPNWFPWWTDGESNLRPEFKPAEITIDPRRVRSGDRAQQYFKSFGMFKSGLYQIVVNVPLGTRLQFSAHGQGWSCEDGNQCPGAVSFNPANMLMRVGIDPYGGTDAFNSRDIVWSPYFNPIDQWQIACATAVSQRENVTVFLWASPDGPRENQDIYWDDASLVALP